MVHPLPHGTAIARLDHSMVHPRPCGTTTARVDKSTVHPRPCGTTTARVDKSTVHPRPCGTTTARVDDAIYPTYPHGTTVALPRGYKGATEIASQQVLREIRRLDGTVRAALKGPRSGSKPTWRWAGRGNAVHLRLFSPCRGGVPERVATGRGKAPPLRFSPVVRKMERGPGG
jgi:hypothetical protein